MCYNNAINWHMPLLVNFDNYFFQLLSVVVSILPMSGQMRGPADDPDHRYVCMWLQVVRKQFVMICVGMLLDIVAPLIGTKLQCLVLIKSIVIVTTWSSRNIWWSKHLNKIYGPLTHEVIFSHQPSRWCCDESGINSEKYFVQIIVLFFEKQLVLLL